MSDDDITLSDVDGWGSDVNYNSDEDFAEDTMVYIARRRKVAADMKVKQKELNARAITGRRKNNINNGSS